MSRYIIGIDLGTTNSAAAYVDTQLPPFAIQLFSIPQFSSLGRVDSFTTLPSFCYIIDKEEWPPGSLKLPWKEETVLFAGQFAKEQGARVPTRLIQSAKSWLCNVAANRKDKILPIEAADPSQKISPVEASAKYLTHIKEAWNANVAKGDPALEFEEQNVILTVPASFDETARSLTIEAAKLAGMNHFTLLEEPQAAFYSWISQNEGKKLNAADSILVCDVGGGTSDFSLIEVQSKNGDLTFQRMAVGDHLLLGGDNMDEAIAHHLEKGLGKTLDTTQWHQLRAEGRAAKEFLLSSEALPHDTYTVVLQGAGSSVVKSSITATIQRNELEDLLLQGFFHQYDLQEALQHKKHRGFRTMGLPYEDEPSITKHLARFLQQAHYLDKGVDYILFNGGALKPEPFQKAILDSIRHWFPEKNPAILQSVSLDLAVARGAAYYGKARQGLGIAIGGGTPRTYYLEVEVKDQAGSINKKALTLLPRGTEEGASYEPDKIFLLRPNTPVSFHLLTSHVRLEDHQGALINIDENEIKRLPPIHSILRFGRKQTEENELIPIRLGIRLTPLGTLELWLQSQKTEHKWNLEFQLRSAAGQEHVNSGARQDETFESQYLKSAQQIIEEYYNNKNAKSGSIYEKLEEQLETERRQWSLSILRGLWDPLLKSASQRKITGEHESRWWNLAGFFLRPGYNFPLDDFRIKELWKIILADQKQTKSSECEIQQWICYRRVAGGLNKGQQMQLSNEMLPAYFTKSGKIEIKNRSDLYIYSEKMRAFASFERVDVPLKIRVGEALVHRIIQNEGQNYDYWALGRIGARHLVYGSIGSVVPKEICSKWVEKLLKAEQLDAVQLPFVLGQLARKTDHREINLPDSLIDEILARDESLKELILNQRTLTHTEQEQLFGDRLPAGVLLEI